MYIYIYYTFLCALKISQSIIPYYTTSIRLLCPTMGNPFTSLTEVTLRSLTCLQGAQGQAPSSTLSRTPGARCLTGDIGRDAFVGVMHKMAWSQGEIYSKTLDILSKANCRETFVLKPEEMQLRAPGPKSSPSGSRRWPRCSLAKAKASCLG